MKKQWSCMAFVLALSMMMSSCTGTVVPEKEPQSGSAASQWEPEKTEKPQKTEEPSVSTESKTSEAAEQSAFSFRPGTWMVTEGEYKRFYFFGEDGSFGATSLFENGMGAVFAYELEGDKAVFHMGAAESYLPCKIVETDDTHVTLEWESGSAETLVFYSELDDNHFHFYTDEELKQLALTYYESRYGAEEPPLSVGLEDNGDGTVTIQLYRNLSDHNSTAAWYQIDRCTGEGKEVNSDTKIDLTRGSPDMDIMYADEEQLGYLLGYSEVIVEESPYRSDVLLMPEILVSDVKVVLLEYAETGEGSDGFRVTKELFSTDILRQEKPLLVRMEMPETMPKAGVLYKDRYGKQKLYGIFMSGLDGAPLLSECTLASSSPEEISNG